MNQKIENNKSYNFYIHKIFIKDLSFEVPLGKEIFTKEWKPKLNLKINHNNKHLKKKFYEVNLQFQCNVQNSEFIAFKIDIKQAGIFEINCIEDKKNYIVNSFCPNLLYFYLRESISDLVTKGGFPQLILHPINFDLLYQKGEKNFAI